MTIDYRAYPVLYVDDEQQNLVVFRYALEDQFTILTTTSCEEALSLLKEGDVAVLIADQRMPEMTGAGLCSRALALSPNTVRTVVTAYADLQAAMSAINDGQVLRYLTKPWRHEEVADVLRDCIDLVHLQRTVHDMEVRLLRRGQSSSAYAIEQELAHEFASPLAGLDLSARLVADLLATSIGSLDDRDKTRALLTHAIEAQTDAVLAVEQMRTLVMRLRQGQRPTSSPPPQTCDASRVVDSTIRIVRAEIEKHAKLHVELEGAPIVPLEASALGQVVLNLLLNASHAVSGPARQNLVAIKVVQSASEVRIVVSDTGPGFTPEDLQRLFDPYFSKAQGHGIGLAIVKELIRRPEGRITAESELGKGATFTVVLPRVWED